MPATAAGELSAIEKTVAYVQLTASASCENERNLRGKLATVPAMSSILRPGPVFAVIAVGDAKLEGDVVEAAELPQVAAKLGDLLLALLAFDFVGR